MKTDITENEGLISDEELEAPKPESPRSGHLWLQIAAIALVGVFLGCGLGAIFVTKVLHSSPTPIQPKAASTISHAPVPQKTETLPDLENLARSLVPAPPPAPPKANKGLKVVDIGPWKPTVIGIVPEGWRVAADPSMEMEYSAPGVTIRGPIYRVVPVDTSIYFIEPGLGNTTVPDQLASTANSLSQSAAMCEQVARALRSLAKAKLVDADKEYLPEEEPEEAPVDSENGRAKETARVQD